MKSSGIVSLWIILFLSLFPALAGGEQVQEGTKEESPSVDQLYNTGYLMSLLGHHEQAIRLFQESLKIQPTAEAYTYLELDVDLRQMRNLLREAKEGALIPVPLNDSSGRE